MKLLAPAFLVIEADVTDLIVPAVVHERNESIMFALWI